MKFKGKNYDMFKDFLRYSLNLFSFSTFMHEFSTSYCEHIRFLYFKFISFDLFLCDENHLHRCKNKIQHASHCPPRPRNKFSSCEILKKNRI